MTNIGHVRAAAKLLGGQRDIPVKLWVAPPTKMDQSDLIEEAHCAAIGTAGARTEMPGCSFCMGNQAQVHEGATVVSTSTLDYPKRKGRWLAPPPLRHSRSRRCSRADVAPPPCLIPSRQLAEPPARPREGLRRCRSGRPARRNT